MVKGGDAFDTMLKNNQEQSTSGHVSCCHCGAVLFRKKDSPPPGESGTFCESFELRAKPKKFWSRIFEVIATNWPLVGNGIPQSTAKYCLEKENLVQELLKEFGDDTEQSLCSFFYVFAKEFVTQLQMAVICRARHH
jgi:hypothetical protein